MKDTFHTNQQRITKIRCTLAAIQNIRHGSDEFTNGQLIGLNHLANEAVASLNSLEEFLSTRKALQSIK